MAETALQLYNLMRTILILACLSLLILPAFAICSSNCSTCFTSSGPGRYLCLSCVSNYFLYSGTQKCYPCANCDFYSECSQCPSTATTDPTTTTTSNSYLYGIIFGCLGGLLLICLAVIYCYYKYFKAAAIPMRDARYASNVQLIEIPQDIQWKKDENPVNRSENCAICLDPEVLLSTQCHHLYHPRCIWEWISKKQLSCPLCKTNKLDPVRIYCSQCSLHYLEINLNAVPKLLEQAKWKICSTCSEPL